MLRSTTYLLLYRSKAIKNVSITTLIHLKQLNSINAFKHIPTPLITLSETSEVYSKWQKTTSTKPLNPL